MLVKKVFYSAFVPDAALPTASVQSSAFVPDVALPALSPESPTFGYTVAPLCHALGRFLSDRPKKQARDILSSNLSLS